MKTYQRVAIAMLACAAAPAMAQDLGVENGAKTWVKLGSGWSKGSFLCAGTDQPQVLAFTTPVRGKGNIVTYRWPGFTTSTLPVTIGDPDVGMSQYYFAVSGGAKGTFHGVNSGALDGTMTSPSVDWVELNDVTTNCRMSFDVVLQAVTPKRFVEIRGNRQGGYTYRAYDLGAAHPDRATVAVTSGKLTAGATTSLTFALGSTTFEVRFATKGAPSGSVVVRQGGKVIGTEPFAAYTFNVH